VIGECQTLFKIENLSVQKSTRNPLADKFRLDIDGLVDKDNTAIVISLALVAFSFPHQMDVHHVLSTELMAICKWLRILHGGKKAINFDVVHPDLLIFVKQVNIEFQVSRFVLHKHSSMLHGMAVG
jgi:hypothetical protein